MTSAVLGIEKKTCIWETPNFSTDADSSTDIFVSVGVKKRATVIFFCQFFFYLPVRRFLALNCGNFLYTEVSICRQKFLRFCSLFLLQFRCWRQRGYGSTTKRWRAARGVSQWLFRGFKVGELPVVTPACRNLWPVKWWALSAEEIMAEDIMAG